MDRSERDAVRRIAGEFRSWVRLAATTRTWREEVDSAAANGEQALAARSVEVARGGLPTWRVVPLEPGDVAVVHALADRADLPRPTTSEAELLRLLAQRIPRALEEVAPLFGVRRIFSGAAKKQAATTAADYLRARHAELEATDVPARLARLGRFTGGDDAAELCLDALLDPGLRFAPLTGATGAAPAVVARSEFEGLPRALAAIAGAVANEAGYRDAVKHSAVAVRDAEVRRVLEQMPVDALGRATRERLRLGPLVEAGIDNVQEVLRRGMALQSLAGVGETSARRMVGAAHTLRKTTFDEMPVRIDIAKRHPETTELLRRLAEWDAARQTRGAATDLERATELEVLAGALGQGVSHLAVIPTRTIPVDGLREGVRIVQRRAELLGPVGASARRGRGADPWEDFLARPADYFAMLSELGFITEDEGSAHGDLPDEIVAAVRDQALSGEHLVASLRGYQSFAARFALVQRKVVIGDEMGLGKTVEAIAVFAHLRSQGENTFLVVCPAAVVTNWMRELSRKSKLHPHRLHGPDRDRAARSWLRDGGVAVTTYETLAWADATLRQVRDLSCVVVDEAHYIKNPQAQRTRRTTALISRARRAILLTGTPLENKVDEFRNLVSYLRPDLRVTASDLEPRAFRREIAQAYLRRNQEDVLTELPELIEVEEWLPLVAQDLARYRKAVVNGNFMEMRQAAMLEGDHSAKVRRLFEIVEEAEANNRRVIVFSYFREVLDLLARSLPGPVFGPLSGSVAANKRQDMVDAFSAARHGAVLVAQIEAGGVGLNIQSASVVVICEPQLKPTTEAQAVARAHRMGQVQSVQVHRLLSEHGVDQRITELLAGKKKVFDDFARVSDLARSSPDAVDLTEAELVREVIAAERRRLAVADRPGG